MQEIVTAARRILEEVKKDSFKGLTRLLSFYKRNFMDSLFTLPLSEKYPEIIQLMNMRVSFNRLLDYLDRKYGLDREIKCIFAGEFGANWAEILNELLRPGEKLPKWIKEYLNLKNACKVSCECNSRLKGLLSEVEDLIGGEIGENSINVLVEAVYLTKSGFRGLDPQSLRKDIWSSIRDDLRDVLCFLSRRLRHFEPLRTLFSQIYLQRLSCLVAERIIQGGLTAPLIFLNTKPIRYSASKRLTVLFDSFRGFFWNALWEMTNDAEIFSEEVGVNHIVEGVKTSWIDWETLTMHRVIVRRDGYLLETPIFPAKLGDAVFILNLEISKERELHETYSHFLEKAGIELVNPYAASKRCDSKFLTHKLIDLYNETSREKVLMPPYVYIPRGCRMREVALKLEKLLSKYNAVIVKPDYGTEGLGIKVFKKGQLQEASAYAFRLAKRQPIIVEKLVGNLFYSRDMKRFSLRIAVSYNGRKFAVEGAFALVAAEGVDVASVSHGGHIEDANKVLANLYINGDKKVSVNKESLSAIIRAAESVAQAINADLGIKKAIKYIGLDFVLAYEEGKIIPIFLEANSRPSALTYLRKLTLLHGPHTPRIIGNLLHYLAEKNKHNRAFEKTVSAYTKERAI